MPVKSKTLSFDDDETSGAVITGGPNQRRTPCQTKGKQRRASRRVGGCFGETASDADDEAPVLHFDYFEPPYPFSCTD
jgi:hypothetical protein